jgi:hypothetical protein
MVQRNWQWANLDDSAWQTLDEVNTITPTGGRPYAAGHGYQYSTSRPRVEILEKVVLDYFTSENGSFFTTTFSRHSKIRLALGATALLSICMTRRSVASEAKEWTAVPSLKR